MGNTQMLGIKNIGPRLSSGLGRGLENSLRAAGQRAYHRVAKGDPEEPRRGLLQMYANQKILSS